MSGVELFDKIDKNLASHGLMSLGSLRPDKSDDVPQGTGMVVLVGPGPDMFEIFRASAFASDGAADPLDRWSYHVLSGVAQDLGGSALFPFGGPPYLPFIRWAIDSGRAWASPVELLVHDTAGLFVSYRGAIALPGPYAPDPRGGTRPCDDCAKPCLAACPVGALNATGYDVPACTAHITSAQGADCLERGCAVRRACPVGQQARGAAQSGFHMRAFAGAER